MFQTENQGQEKRTLLSWRVNIYLFACVCLPCNAGNFVDDGSILVSSSTAKSTSRPLPSWVDIWACAPAIRTKDSCLSPKEGLGLTSQPWPGANPECLAPQASERRRVEGLHPTLEVQPPAVLGKLLWPLRPFDGGCRRRGKRSWLFQLPQHITC